MTRSTKEHSSSPDPESIEACVPYCLGSSQEHCQGELGRRVGTQSSELPAGSIAAPQGGHTHGSQHLKRKKKEKVCGRGSAPENIQVHLHLQVGLLGSETLTWLQDKGTDWIRNRRPEPESQFYDLSQPQFPYLKDWPNNTLITGRKLLGGSKETVCAKCFGNAQCLHVRTLGRW